MSSFVELQFVLLDRRTNTLRAWHGCLPPGIWHSPGTSLSHSLYRTKPDASQRRGRGEWDETELHRAGGCALRVDRCSQPYDTVSNPRNVNQANDDATRRMGTSQRHPPSLAILVLLTRSLAATSAPGLRWLSLNVNMPPPHCRISHFAPLRALSTMALTGVSRPLVLT